MVARRFRLFGLCVDAALAGASTSAPVPGNWENPVPEHVCRWDEVVSFQGSNGSLWLSREERVDVHHWPDVGPPDNIFVFSKPSPKSFSANVSATLNSTHDGEQAGIYLYHNARSWVKFVVEGNGAGVQLSLAEQVDLVPFLRGKVPLPQGSTRVALRVAVAEDRTAVAEWAPEGGHFRPMLRGLGWLEPSELPAGASYGSLTPGDPRGEQPAACQAPASWSAALVAEQWNISEWQAAAAGAAPCVQFSDFQVGAAWDTSMFV